MLKQNALIISHRGNTLGPNEYYENAPKYIEDAIVAGFEVEIDVWKIGLDWYTGHDRPTFHIDFDWLQKYNSKLWSHSKNLDAYYWLLECGHNTFYHTDEDYVLTSSGLIWTYPNKNLKITDRSIAVLPEKVKGWEIAQASGVCTDFAILYKNLCIE